MKHLILTILLLTVGCTGSKTTEDWQYLEEGYFVYPTESIQTYFCKKAGTSYGILYGSDCRDVSCLYPGARFVRLDLVVLKEGITFKAKDIEWMSQCGRDVP